MKLSSFHLLRVGLAITFLWIGLLIFKNPEAWGGYIQPWAMAFLPMPIKELMLTTAVLDLLIGFFLLIDTWTWVAATLASAHLAVVLTVSGINEVTVRDIGLLAGGLAVAWEASEPVRRRWMKK